MEKISYRVPKFLSNTILRSKDLNSVNKNIYNAGLLEYEDLKNGIIKGLEVEILDNNIWVNKGIFKKDDVIYVDEKLKIEIPQKEGKYILTINYEKLDKEYVIEKLIYLSLESDDKFEGIEIARFNIREGSTLIKDNYEYKKFEEKYNTLDFTYSINSKTDINPNILKKWSDLMLNKSKNTFDYIICFMCKLEMFNLEILIKYINKKLNENNKNLDNNKVLEKLYQIVENTTEIEEIEELSSEFSVN